MPVTSVARTLVDLAAMLPHAQLRRALAEADHLRLLDPNELTAVLRSGQPGGRALGRALARHLPTLAETRSVLEQRFLVLCEGADLPLPEVNASVVGLEVDALWREQRLVVEVDGHQAHAYPAAAERDRDRELRLRSSGYRVLRYTWRQVTERPEAVIGELRRELAL